MEYPFIYSGSVFGTLTVTESGLFTVFELITQYTPEILRVYVRGGGKSFYLGIPEPRGKGLYLCRRLSKREMLAVPESIEYASCGERGVQNAEVPQSTDGTVWTRHSDGTLRSGDLIAIPAALSAMADGVRLKIIEGRTYMLFRY